MWPRGRNPAPVHVAANSNWKMMIIGESFLTRPPSGLVQRTHEQKGVKIGEILLESWGEKLAAGK